MKLVSEAMIVVDHPKEPMTIRVQFRLVALSPDHVFWDPTQQRAATVRILARHPELLRSFHLARDGLRVEQLTPVEAHESLAAVVWEYPPEGSEWVPEVSQAPLFRLRLNPVDGICLTAHHALLDGRSAFALIHELLTELLGSAVAAPPGAGDLGPGLRDLLRPRVLGELIQRVCIGWRRPPVLLGDEQRLFGTRHFYVDGSLPREDLKAIREGVRALLAGCTLHDGLLAALHLAIADVAEAKRATQRAFGGRDRIAVMVPVDLRQGGGTTVFTNLTAAVSVDSSESDRADLRRLLGRVRARMAHVNRYHLEHASILRLACLRWFGILRQARRIKLASGFPRRASVGSARFWRRLDTALLTNLGNVRLSRDVNPVLRTIEGCAPVLPPMGVSLSSAVLGESLFLYLRASNATLSLEEAHLLMDRWKARLLELRADGGPRGARRRPAAGVAVTAYQPAGESA